MIKEVVGDEKDVRGYAIFDKKKINEYYKIYSKVISECDQGMEDNIRLINENDIDSVVEIFMNAYSNSPWNENWSFDDVKMCILDSINSPNRKIFVYLSDNKIVGAIIIEKVHWHWGNEIEIKELFVKPSYQSMGVGTSLFKYIEKYAKNNNYKKISFYTYDDTKLINFYKKNNCSISSDTIIMEKELV